MTSSELETLARLKFNAVNDSFFSPEEIHSYISEACKKASIALECVEGYDSSLTTVASQRNYALPTGAFKIKTLLVDGQPLEEISIKQGEDGNIWHGSIEGTPNSFYRWAGSAYLNPIPSESSLTIEYYYYLFHPVVSTSATTIYIPEEFQEELINPVLAIMYAKDQNIQMATYYTNLWTGENLPSMRSSLRRRRGGFQKVRNVD